MPSIHAVTRFLQRVNKTDGCWLWIGKLRGNTEYGEFWFNGHARLAHRVAYKLFNGEIPRGLVVMHTCNNKKCVNPGHLKVGTYAENSQAAVRDGLFAMGDNHWSRRHPERVRRGEKNNKAKITEAHVVEIRNMAASGLGKRLIALKYGLGVRTVYHIVNGDHWRHVPIASPDGGGPLVQSK